MSGVFFYTRPVRKPGVSIERQVDHREVMIQQRWSGVAGIFSRPLPAMEARMLAEMYSGRGVRGIVRTMIESAHRNGAEIDHAFPVIY